MFWGSFAGVEGGPHEFWDAEWWSIKPEEYRQHILPSVLEWIGSKPESMNQHGVFMHEHGLYTEVP